MKIGLPTVVITTTYAVFISGEPFSRPYIAHYTNPFDQRVVKTSDIGGTSSSENDSYLKSTIQWRNDDNSRPTVQRNDNFELSSKGVDGGDPNCPMAFKIGFNHRSSSSFSRASNGISRPPVIYPIHPADGAGKGILFLRDMEHLDMLTPSDTYSEENVNDNLKMDQQFPLLFEGSTFGTASPIIHDVNGDGIEDAIIVDYDGGISIVGLDYNRKEDNRKVRYLRENQIPRLNLRKDWVEMALNETKVQELVKDHFTPYYSFFEYGAEWKTEQVKKIKERKIVRGISADVLDQNVDVADLLHSNRNSQSDEESNGNVEEQKEAITDVEDVTSRRRLQEVPPQNEHGVNVDTETSDTNTDADTDTGAVAEQIDAKEDSKHEYYYPQYYGGDDMQPNRGAMYDRDDDLFDSTTKEEREKQRDEYYGAFYENMEEREKGITSTDEHKEEADLDNEEMDDYYIGRRVAEDDDFQYHYDDDYGYHTHNHNSAHSRFYADQNYIRVPPHVLSTPTYFEMPKRWKKETDSPFLMEEFLIFAVSYYFDEDEFDGVVNYKRFKNDNGGDETEEQRGRFMASALVLYDVESNRFSNQIHLDLSTDVTAPLTTDLEGKSLNDHDTFNGMAALTMVSPTVADLNGDGTMEVLSGTSMGLVYCLKLPELYQAMKFPVQMKYPIEQPIVVEDVMGNTSLEIFIVDSGGNVVCLNHDGETMWHRDLIGSGEREEVKRSNENAGIRGTSAMMLGDINGDGELDIVITVRFISGEGKEYLRIYAISARTGDNLENFPRQIDPYSDDEIQRKRSTGIINYVPIITPLLIDLHSSQSHWLGRIQKSHANSSNASKRNLDVADVDFRTSKSEGKIEHGGKSQGLHIVQPALSNLYVLEGGSGCFQTMNVGDNISTMVQVDDVHGTGTLDLVVTTVSGEILTLELPDTVPYHPLNVHPRPNSYVHGYSASSGIFVHDNSRQYRDALGGTIPITFEIFDARPNISLESDKKHYMVEIRDGSSSERSLFRKIYDDPGVYTERIHIPDGPGYYTILVRLRTTHGLVYEDVFHLGFNVKYTVGMAWILLLPFFIAIVPLFCFRRKPNWEQDDDYGGRGTGILGMSAPTKKSSSFLDR